MEVRLTEGVLDEVDDTRAGFAAQAGVGLRGKITQNVALDVGYRYKVIIDTLMRGKAAGETIDRHTAGTFENHVLQAALSWYR